MENLKAIKSIHNVLSAIETHKTFGARDPNWQGDDELLMSLGYKPQMRREFNSLELFGVAFSIMSLVPSIASSFTDSLSAGGVGMTWSWIVASAFVMSVGISMSELASAQPTSGGLYYWAFQLAPKKLKRPFSFLTGYTNTLGLVGGVCSINYGFATLLMSIPTISSDGKFMATKYEQYGIFVAVTFVQLACISLPTFIISKFQTICVILNLVLVILVIIAVPVGAHNNGILNSGTFIYTNHTNTSDWQYGWSFLLSMMTCIWTIGAFDSAVHTSEEATNAQEATPKAIIMSISMCSLLGFGVMSALASAMPMDFTEIVQTWTGQPMAAVLIRALGKKWTIAILALMVIAQFGMGLSILFAASRQVFAFARDGALPFSRIIKYVVPRTGVPLFAGVFTAIFACAICCLVLINGTTALALFSLSSSSTGLAWLIPIFCKLLISLRRKEDMWKPGPFYLGAKLSCLNNLISVLWLSFLVFVLTMIPTTKKVDKDTMNYTVAINVSIWILSLVILYTFKKDFKGPKIEIEVHKAESLDSDTDLYNHMDKGSKEREITA